jgi:hypothetical protein
VRLYALRRKGGRSDLAPHTYPGVGDEVPEVVQDLDQIPAIGNAVKLDAIDTTGSQHHRQSLGHLTPGQPDLEEQDRLVGIAQLDDDDGARVAAPVGAELAPTIAGTVTAPTGTATTAVTASTWCGLVGGY